MKGKLEIIKPGLMTSIQDLGRRGMTYYGIPASGVMDENAAKIANLLLHKSENEPVIECTSLAPEIRFHNATEIVVTGADFNWKINDKIVQLNNVISIDKGDILKGKFAKTALRGYVATRGQFDIEQIFDSYATYTNAKIGGFKGRLLQKGDMISWKNGDKTTNNIFPIFKGPEFEWLSESAKKLLFSSSYTINADTNRMGMRLKGPTLESKNYQLLSSAPILPGFIQLPPNGQPIIVLQDGQTTGGYPRIAYLKPSSLSRLNQVPINGNITFKLES